MASLYLLSYSALVGMTLQLLACLARVQLLVACKSQATREIQLRVPASLHNLEHFFILCHVLPLYDSHLNTGLLIAKIQSNLARNKANKMVNKIQPYNHITCLVCMWTCHFLFAKKKIPKNTNTSESVPKRGKIIKKMILFPFFQICPTLQGCNPITFPQSPFITL